MDSNASASARQHKQTTAALRGDLGFARIKEYLARRHNFHTQALPNEGMNHFSKLIRDYEINI